MIKKTLQLLMLSAWCLSPAMAQEEEDEVGENKQPRAEARGWILQPDGPVRLLLGGEEGQEPRVLAAGNRGSAAVGEIYQGLPPGRVVFNLQDAEDKVLATATGAVRDGSFYTAIAWPQGGRWQLKVFADTVNPGAMDRALRIVNFPEGRDTLVDMHDGKETKVPGDTVVELKVPARLLMTTVKVLSTDGGPPAQSTVELDLASAPAAYVMVSPDYRGRMRPRIIQAGQGPEDVVEDAAAEESADEQR